MRHGLFAGGALALLLAAAAGAQAQAPPQAQPQPGPAAPAEMRPNGHGPMVPMRIPVVAAGDLAGTQVRDALGHMIGELRHVMIDQPSGQIRFVLVQSDAQLVAVPWPLVNVVQAERPFVQLTVQRQWLAQAPRFGEDEVHTLPQPAVTAAVAQHFGLQPPQPQQADTAVLVGRDSIVVLSPGRMERSDDLRDTDVRGAMGESLGEIDRVMLDTAHGQVAFVLIERGGFLGIGGDEYPVPFNALRWMSDEQAYVLAASEADVAPVEALGDEPGWIDPDRLFRLHQRYAVAPYWHQEAMAPGMQQAPQ